MTLRAEDYFEEEAFAQFRVGTRLYPELMALVSLAQAAAFLCVCFGLIFATERKQLFNAAHKAATVARKVSRRITATF